MVYAVYHDIGFASLYEVKLLTTRVIQNFVFCKDYTLQQLQERNLPKAIAFCPLGFMFSPPSLKYILGTINVGLGIWSGFSNFLAMIALSSADTLRTRSNLFLGSLAMTNLLNGFLVEPLLVASFLSEQMQQNFKFASVRRLLLYFLGLRRLHQLLQ